MTHQPTVIKLGDIAEVIAREFPARDMLTVYVGSNAATPTASLDAITEALKAGWPKLPYLRMVHILLQGPLSYVEEGLKDRVMAFSIFSGSNVRKAANEGRAFYLPCTLANACPVPPCGYRVWSTSTIQQVGVTGHTPQLFTAHY